VVSQPSPTQRFSSRAENYARYRPDYPAAALDWMAAGCGLREGWKLADVGSGTGLLSRQLLERGCKVFAVEPNEEMRKTGERLLSSYPGFVSVAGRAEATGLPPQSMDCVVAGQAFHWFDRQRAREEFRRILRPQGAVALLWNYRKLNATPFLAAYEALLHRYCPGYAEILDRDLHRRQVEEFFEGRVTLSVFDHCQDIDWTGLEGRHLSQSYVPLEGPQFTQMMAELRELFEAHQRDGHVAFEYETRLYCGRP
jgi:SAM-dependent methyltransferase